MGVNFREAKTRSAGEKRWEESHKEIDWPVGAASSRDDLSPQSRGNTKMGRLWDCSAGQTTKTPACGATAERSALLCS